MIRSLISVVLIALISPAQRAWTAPGDPASLQLKVVEGDGATYAPGSRATRGVGVVVVDENGRPVEGATIGFALPAGGPGGEFASGGKTEIITTKGDGVATAWGMRWNRTAGPFEIRVTAVKGTAQASVAVKQYLSGLPQPASNAAGGGGGGHKWLWIALAGGAAAGAAGFAIKGRSSGSSSTTNTSGAVQIGSPSISLGQP